MGAVWFQTYSAGTVEAWRSLRKRARKNPFLTTWFIILLVFFIGIVLAFSGYADLTETEFLAADAGSIILLVFFVSLAKSLATNVRRVVRHQPLTFYMTQPHHTGEFLLGFLCMEIMFNLGLLALVAGIAYLEIMIVGFYFVPNPLHFAQLILAVIAGSILGFTFSIFNSVYPLKKRIPLLFLISIPGAAIYIILDTMPTESRSVLLMAIPLGIAVLGLLPAFSVFPETWNRATAADSGIRRSIYDRTTGRFAPRMMRWIGWESALFLEKELVEKYRAKDVFGSAIAVGAVFAATLYSLGKLSDFDLTSQNMLARILPPLIIGMGLFVGSILEPGISSLSAFGREGKAIWVVKTSPVDEREIVKAKALASTYTIPFLSIFVGALAAFSAGYGMTAMIFASIMGATMGTIAIGVGIWLGVRAPNFDQNVKGYPDIITIYTYSMACLVLCFLAAAIPFFLALQVVFIGLMAATFALDMAVLFLYLCIGSSAKQLRKMESP